MLSPAVWFLHAVQLEEPTGATIALPVEIVLRIAVTTQLEAKVLASRTVSEGHMVVSDVVEKVDLVFVEQESSRYRVHRRISPTLVEETAIAIEALKEIDVGIAA